MPIATSDRRFKSTATQRSITRGNFVAADGTKDRQILVHMPNGLLILFPGVAVLAFSCWYEGKWPFANQLENWLAGAAIVAVLSVILYHVPALIVIDRSSLRYIRWRRVVAKYDLCDIEDVRGHYPTVILFSHNRRIRIYDLWIGYGEAIAFLKFVLDGKRAANMPTPTKPLIESKTADVLHLPIAEPQLLLAEHPSRVELPLRQITFPDGCVSCHRPAVCEFPLKVWRGVDLVLWAYGRVAWLPAPLCNRCLARRRWLGYLWTFVFLTFWVIALWRFTVYEQQHNKRPNEQLSPAISIAMIVAALGAVYYWRNHLRARLDRQLLGVGARSLSSDGETVTLNFADPKFATQVCQLTTQMQQARIQLAQQILRDNPPK